MLPRSPSAHFSSLFLAALMALQPGTDSPTAAVTVITIGPPLRTGVKRLGINLSGQTYYDSGQMLRNLVFRNPGFEGEMRQSILRCKQATATTCTDQNPYTVWPAGFLDGAHFEFLSGPAKGKTGTIASSSAVSPGKGIALTFAALPTPPAPGDFILVRIDKPGHAEAGWWTELRGGAELSTEFHDLAPDTLGKQALRISAAGPGQTAAIFSYFDSTEGRSFLHLHGTLHLSFRAKAVAGNEQVRVLFQRLDTVHGNRTFLDEPISLVPNWQDLAYDFPANDIPGAIGALALAFRVDGASILIDDVSLTSDASLGNPTAFRDEVVSTLHDLHPGILRYMDNGTDFGSSLENMVTVLFGRRRSGFSTQTTEQEDLPIGLNEFLVLCKEIGAEPWYTMPAGTSPNEARALIEFLAGDAKTSYGGFRAKLGQPVPWTSVFPVIHLELGNEVWNEGSFYGAVISDPAVFGQRAAEVFAGARSHPAFDPGKFDLVLGAWAANDWWTSQELEHSGGYDSTAVAPYLFSNFNEAWSNESIFGPMFAEPELFDSTPKGVMSKQLAAARKATRPANLSVYEVNLGTVSGSASQKAIDSAVPSVGAGLAVIDHMLLMLRDLGITDQALFSLPEFANGFKQTDGTKLKIPLWGAVVDMGGEKNLRRPTFLAEQLANQAILPTLLSTKLSGDNPTWTQPNSRNDGVSLAEAHLLQTFAFSDPSAHDEGHRSLILLNLSRTASLPVTFAGDNAPKGRVEQALLTSAHITDNNETSVTVKVDRKTLPAFDPAAPYLLPQFSMIVLTWTTKP